MNSNDRLGSCLLYRHVKWVYESRLIPGWEKRENRIEFKVLINKSLFYGDFNYRVFCCFTNDSRFNTPTFTFHCARESFLKSFKSLNGKMFSWGLCNDFSGVLNRTYICYNYFPSSQTSPTRTLFSNPNVGWWWRDEKLRSQHCARTFCHLLYFLPTHHSRFEHKKLFISQSVFLLLKEANNNWNNIFHILCSNFDVR